MYPTLYHALLDLFGWDLPGLKLINSFGFFVALAFAVAAALLRSEINRKQRLGIFQPVKETHTTGLPPNPWDIGLQALLGFLLGWKLLYLFFQGGTLFADGRPPQAHLFSGEGNVLWGLLMAAVFGGWRYWEVRKQMLPQPRVETLTLPASVHVGGIVTAAVIGGMLGAKLFHLLEYPEELVAFFQRPSLNNLLGGLTVYGGLIIGTLAVAIYARRQRLPFWPLADAAAPGMMLAYGIGRIGCQVSGDGDWGLPNPQPKPGWLGWAPDWVWSYNYPNNVNAVFGEKPAGYAGKLIGPEHPWPIFDGYGTYLDPGVFPTPLYETLMATAIFALLWAMRKRWKITGAIFAAYLFFNGLERILIEQIRVNTDLSWWPGVTQAELIAALTLLGGAVAWVGLHRRHRAVAKAG